jgi:hypothetical protein
MIADGGDRQLRSIVNARHPSASDRPNTTAPEALIAATVE